jgi:beta-xylosidase
MAGARVSIALLTALALASPAASPDTRGRPPDSGPAWIADQGDGTYRNPVLHADYSDPDVVRVGADYYLVSSSFNVAPGLPILHSRDLVNWTIVSHAFARQVPEDVFSAPQHGKGVWAPCLRFHQGTFRLYYPDPDFGIYVTTARDPAGPWSPPVLVKGGKGLIDPSPLFDDDGQVYLVHAWAKSRSGINNVLTLLRLSPDGTKAVGEGQVIVDGNQLPGYSTLEGPKLYKRAGYYYIFAPAGGVKTGWQSVFRSRRIEGPYEDRIVLEQGGTAINGPHQGAWVDTPRGEDWFLHFQDKEAYGRVVHLQPLTWRSDGWPVMGADPDGNGRGEPVLTGRKPLVAGAHPVAVPQTSDEFDAQRLSLQWQWQANPRPGWVSLEARRGVLRLFSQPPVPGPNLWMTPHLLLQKWPAPEFVVTTSVSLAAAATGERAGLIVWGHDYAWIGVHKTASGHRLSLRTAENAKDATPEHELAGIDVPGGNAVLRVAVSNGGSCQFSYRLEGGEFTALGPSFKARPGHWIGAKVGVFATAAPDAAVRRHVDIDWFNVTR